MGGTGQVALAATAFVGTHSLLSHPLRAPLVRGVTGRGFLLLYSLVAAGTLGWMAWAYRRTPATAMLWPVGDGIWAVVSAVMLVASVLLVGSLIGNPAMVDPNGRAKMPDSVRAVRRFRAHDLAGGLVVWLAATWTHMPLAGVAADIWRWV